ncbi:DUF1062 domain-containing protein [Micromonospora trifolii]|uniref:DUF1062 domain-containing protein n=1 Tax=Micromonospora trifolii TaxID=2911208 RepID=UPI003D2EA0C7
MGGLASPSRPTLQLDLPSPTLSREDFTPRDAACSLDLTPSPCIGRRRRRRLFSHAFRQVFRGIMSTHPHIVPSWAPRRTHLRLLAFRCVHCHSGLASTGDGKFRVNANGKLLDILLLVTCVSCDPTSKITVHDRVPVWYLNPLLGGCSGNSSRGGPEPGREARWPCPGLHHAAVRARSLMTARERRSGPARYRRRR